MTKTDIQRLRDLPIEGVAERLGLHVSRHKSLCPFHEDSHPSLSYNRSHNRYRCFVCDAHGGTIDLAMRVLGKSFPEACQWLAGEHNVILTQWQPAEKPFEPKPFDAARYSRFFDLPFLNDAARRFLFEERRLDPRVVSWCRLTSYTDRNGTPWLQIPYYDIDGHLIGVQNRNLAYGKPAAISNQSSAISHQPSAISSLLNAHSSQPIAHSSQLTAHCSQLNAHSSQPIALPRFRFPMGSRCHIYNLPVLKFLREGEPLYITEGASDCWAMLSSGHKAIAIPSATLLNRKDIELIRSLLIAHHSSLHMFPDNDEPGERLFLQLSDLLPQILRHQLPPGCKDYSDMYMSKVKKM